MKLSEKLNKLFNELENIQPNGVLDPSYLSKGWIPNFVTASNQQQIFFNKDQLLRQILTTIAKAIIKQVHNR